MRANHSNIQQRRNGYLEMSESKIPEIIASYESDLLAEWSQDLTATNTRKGLIKQAELQEECREFLKLLRVAVQQGNLHNLQAGEWRDMREMLTGISRSRSQQGFTSTETATFVFSLKQQVLQQVQPAAIVLDILLEGQNGWTFLRELKSDETTRNIPVLIITVIDNEKQAIALGANGFLLKPVDRLPLLNRLNMLIE